MNEIDQETVRAVTVVCKGFCVRKDPQEIAELAAIWREAISDLPAGPDHIRQATSMILREITDWFPRPAQFRERVIRAASQSGRPPILPAPEVVPVTSEQIAEIKRAMSSGASRLLEAVLGEDLRTVKIDRFERVSEVT